MAGLINTKLTTLLEKTLDFRSQRHDLLASNVANKDTPGYHAQDLVFEKNLEKALHADKPGELRTTNPLHMDGNDTPPMELVQAKRITSSAPFVGFDGNTVDLDREMAKIAENQLMYSAATRMISSQFSKLKTVISES
ncbi:MAG: flagellar basal body rod protein FlgB [SAR324 cluster bacterium]|nr:flagellar basal body rod protein FlgB [SAR324 cluster bacterium]